MSGQNKQQSMIMVDGIAIDHNMVQLVKRLIEHHQKMKDYFDLKRSLFMIQNAVFEKCPNELCLDAQKLSDIASSFYHIYTFYEDMEAILNEGGTDEHN